jgi:hypothetical protein
MAAAQATNAQAEGNAISATSEFAAIQFIASATGKNIDVVARIVIMTISAIPDVLAVLLLIAATAKIPTPVKPIRRRHKVAPGDAPHRRQHCGLSLMPRNHASTRTPVWAR